MTARVSPKILQSHLHSSDLCFRARSLRMTTFISVSTTPARLGMTALVTLLLSAFAPFPASSHGATDQAKKRGGREPSPDSNCEVMRLTVW